MRRRVHLVFYGALCRRSGTSRSLRQSQHLNVVYWTVSPLSMQKQKRLYPVRQKWDGI
ncbi:MAG: hypothetical protein HFF69_06760 [Oscillospiraceae bacterium]|nr:hypothetical protein [Oscillospiraceae bacterium]